MLDVLTLDVIILSEVPLGVLARFNINHLNNSSYSIIGAWHQNRGNCYNILSSITAYIYHLSTGNGVGSL